MEYDIAYSIRTDPFSEHSPVEIWKFWISHCASIVLHSLTKRKAGELILQMPYMFHCYIEVQAATYVLEARTETRSQKRSESDLVDEQRLRNSRHDPMIKKIKKLK